MRRDLADLVGPLEIAERLACQPGAVRVWISRGWPSGRRGEKVAAPPRLATISGTPIFAWPDVRRWAIKTGRLEVTP